MLNPLRPESQRANGWIRYVVPFREPGTDTSLPIDVYSPDGDPKRAAVCATVVAYLWHAGAGR